MIKNWKQFNEERQLDLFAGTSYEKPELIHNNLYPIDEDDIRDYLAEIEDEKYIIQVNFGFLSKSTGEYTELIDTYDVRPCISVNIMKMTIDYKVVTGNEDVTSCLTSFIKRISHKFKEIKVRDDEGYLNIEDIKLEGGIFLKSESGNIEDEIELISPLCIQLVWFEDVHLTDKMIFDYYGIPTDDSMEFTKNGSLQISVSRDKITGWLLKASKYRDILDDNDYDPYEFYDESNWFPEHDSFLKYDLEEETIQMLLRCCLHNFDELKKEGSNFLANYESLEDLIKKTIDGRKKLSYDFDKLGKFLNEVSDMYGHLRGMYADYSLQTKADDDYEEIIRTFDKIVEDQLETKIIKKISKQEPLKYKTKDLNNQEIYKETTIEKTYYVLSFNLQWLSKAGNLFNLGSLEQAIDDWCYYSIESVELNPNFSDYPHVDDKKFNEEARKELKDALNKL
jgi:hypothetical protein